ncbi:MAG: helix-turn-helix transcriptional regulator [Gammaproteobacteria bacterium]|nr:helix-turn-helix transcriptional regulator [Gammaproteobacteria bacterium]
MLAVVKKPHTENSLFEVKGEIPKKLIQYLQDNFGDDVKIVDEDEETVDLFSSDWFKETTDSLTSGEIIKIYRENRKLTQEQLGKQLGKFTRQNVSDIELGRRSISKEVAKKLSVFFNVSVERFIL